MSYMQIWGEKYKVKLKYYVDNHNVDKRVFRTKTKALLYCKSIVYGEIKQVLEIKHNDYVCLKEWYIINGKLEEIV